MLDELIVRYGYLAVIFGTFLEGEAVLLAAGVLAHKGLLSFALVLGSATLGSLAWGQLWFQLGRAFGRPIIERRPRWSARVGLAERFIQRYGAGFVLCFRFVSGMGTLAPALLGATGFAARRFLLFDTIGAGLWAFVFESAGFGLDLGLREALGRPIRWHELLLAMIALGVLVWLTTRTVQRILGRKLHS